MKIAINLFVVNCISKNSNICCYFCRVETLDSIIKNPSCINCNEFKPFMKIIDYNLNYDVF